MIANYKVSKEFSDIVFRNTNTEEVRKIIANFKSSDTFIIELLDNDGFYKNLILFKQFIESGIREHHYEREINIILKDERLYLTRTKTERRL